MKSLKIILLTLSISLLQFNVGGVATAGALSPIPLAQIAADSHGDACNGLSQVGGSCGGGQGSLSKVLSGVVNIISYIAGVIAIIMIIIAGIRFTTSGGDSNSVSAAKTSLIYALVGIVVAALAQVLVHLILNKTNV